MPADDTVPPPGARPAEPADAPAPADTSDAVGGSVTREPRDPSAWVGVADRDADAFGLTRDASNVEDAGRAGHPARVGRYRIVRPIGEGGMGAVYLAEQTEPIKRLVALKLILGGYASRQVLVRFDSERQALARMDHPNVAKVLDAGEGERGQPYFVMEYVDGSPIVAFADEHRLTIRQRLELFAQVCDAIAHAHGKALLHRDIKSGNVLAYVAEGRSAVKVIDFGIAKAIGAEKLVDATLTVGGGAMGTPYAMSPEQADGSSDIDTRTDIYALGVLLYELLCGRLPFELDEFADKTLTQMLDMVRRKEPPLPSAWLSYAGPRADEIATARSTKVAALIRDLRRELEWIPLKAMRKDRDRRYASVQQLADDVKNYLASRPLIAGPESRAYRARKFVARNSAAVVVGMLVLITAAGGVIGWITSLKTEQAKTAQALRVTDGVAQFMKRAFAQASPYLGRTDATLMDGVVAAAKDLDQGGWIDNSPEVRGRIELQIGQILSDNGVFDQAEIQLRRGVTRLGSIPAAALEVADAFRLLSWGLLQRGKLDEARSYADRAIEVYRREQSGGSRECADTINNVGLIQLEQRQFAEAQRSFAEALTMVRAAKQDELSLRLVGLCLQNLGGVAEKQGRDAEAIAFYRQALAQLAVIPGNEIRVAKIENNLGNASARQRDFPNAITHLTAALELYARLKLDALPESLSATATLASAYRNAGNLALAEAASRRAIAGMEKRLPEMAGDLANAKSGLGRALLATPGRAAEAEPYLLAAFDYRLANHADGLDLTTDALVKCYETLGHPERAAAVRAKREAGR